MSRHAPSVTVPGMLWRTLLLFIVLHVSAIAGILWTVAPTVASGNPLAVTALPGLLGLVTGVGTFATLRNPPRMTPLLIILAVTAEGLFLGGIATYFEGRLPGIVLQVAFAMLSVVVAFLSFAAIGRVRQLRRGPRTLLLMAGGYLVFAVHNLTLMEMSSIRTHTAWGQGSVFVLGTPLGLLLALLVAPSIAYALARAIEHMGVAVDEQTPAPDAWRAGLHIMALILWHLIETPQNLSRSRGAAERPLPGSADRSG